MILCDFHIHLGKSRDGGALEIGTLKLHMQQAGIRTSVVFPIDEPDNFPSYEKQNTALMEAVKHDARLIPFCRINPVHRKAAQAELERCYISGFKGLKLHPRAESILPNTIEFVFKKCDEYSWPIVMHISHERNCHPRSWEASFRRFPRVKFILAHSGKDSYREAIQMAGRYENLFMDTSTLSTHRTRLIIDALGAGRVLFASDEPYSHMVVERTKFEVICTPNELELVFRKNATLIFPNLKS